MWNLPTALYRHFNEDGGLLYVGVSKDPFQRMSEHIRQSSWMKQVQGITITWYDTRILAEAAEDLAILNEKPANNIRGNSLNRSNLRLSTGGVGRDGRNFKVTTIAVSAKSKEVIKEINRSSRNPRQLIVDILFIYRNNWELFDSFYRNHYNHEDKREAVNIPANGEIYSHLKSIECGCGENLETTIDALFLFYCENGCKIPEYSYKRK